MPRHAGYSVCALSMSQPSPSTSSLFRSARKLAPYFRARPGVLAGALGLGVATAGLSALEPLLLKYGFDAMLERTSLLRPLPYLGLLAALLISGELLSAWQNRLVWRLRLGLDFSLMQTAVEQLHALPLSYHREQSVAATMTQIERGIAGTMNAFSELTLRLLPALVYLTVSLFVMYRLEWHLALAVSLVAPWPALLGARAAPEQMARERSLLERWTRLFGRFNEVLTGILVVKSYVMEEQEKRRFLGGVADANTLVLQGVRLDTRTQAYKNLLSALARLCALGVGGVLVMRDEITLGTLLAFVSYLGGVLQPVQALTGMYQTLRRASVSLDAVLQVIDAQVCLVDAPDAREAERLQGAVEFRDLSFGYRPERAVLRDINLSVSPGEKLALVGASGAGKTTLMCLLQRLYDPEHGAIRIDGQDIRCFTQRSLRAQIGVVLQEGSLFSDSVRDNIAFGKPGASQAEIEAAARAAHAHEFILTLPCGYDTPIGERGCKLSGGERQRIAIARALLKDAPILVLDEATSALDAESEELVQAALAELTRGRTTFIIAHRLATIVTADRIAVFREGRVLEIGSHADLMRANAYYASLIRKQLPHLAA
jgi:ATP-binding cassette, subfamily B, bacterial